MKMSIEKIEVLKIDGQMFPICKEKAHELKTLLTHAVEVLNVCDSGAHNLGADWDMCLTIELEDIDGTTEQLDIRCTETAEELLGLISELV